VSQHCLHKGLNLGICQGAWHTCMVGHQIKLLL
jgi:hypothetical protein